MFITTAKLIIPTETQTNEENAAIKTQPVTEEARIDKCLTKFKFKYPYVIKSLIKSLCFISSKT